MNQSQDSAAPDYETITALAYRLCLDNGCQPGDALRYWQEAELWLRYRDVDPAMLEIQLQKQGDHVDSADVTPAHPEAGPVRSADPVLKITFAFREASFALPGLRSLQPTSPGGWRPRNCRPSRSGGRRLQFRPPT